MSPILVTGAGAVSAHGLGLSVLRAAAEGAPAPWSTEELRPGDSVPVGRVGRLQDADSEGAYDRWGQVDTYSRYGMSAARMALQSAGLGSPDPRREALGVVFGTAWGCVEENQRFERWDVVDGKVVGAAPIVFKVTVDNAPGGWVAVAFKLRGPNETFVSGDGAAAEAFWASVGLLEREVAPGLLVGGVERIVDLHLALQAREPVLHEFVPSEGAGVLLLEREDAWRNRGGPPPLAELEAVLRARGPELPPLLQDARLPPASEVGLVVHAGARGLDAAFSDRFPQARVLAGKTVLGEPGGAWGGLAAALVIALRDPGSGWSGRPRALVHARGEGREHFFIVLKEPHLESS